MIDNYEDIINLEHYEPKNHKRMSRESRAAQFAPFAALTGYEDEVKETARLTEKKIILDNDTKFKLNETLNILNNRIKDKPFITLTYFIKDEKKSGGKYVNESGILKRIDYGNKFIKLNNNKIIYLKDIINIVIDS